MSSEHPHQLELPGMDEAPPAGLELTLNELLLLTQLAETGRDLLRGHLLSNQIPTKEVFKVKSVVTRADRLLERLMGHLKHANKPAD